MIASVRGPVVGQGLDWLVLEVSGVGFKVQVPPSVVANYRQHLDGEGVLILHTDLVVREDALTLIGFLQDADQATFQTLMTVAGIGPKLALAAIDVLGTDGLRAAVTEKDLKKLMLIPGVGKKTAQRMVLEIGDKLGAAVLPAAPTPSAGSSQVADSVEAALSQLGWPAATAKQAVADLATEDHTTESLLRAALAQLGGGLGTSI